MTELNSSSLRKLDPDVSRTGPGTMLPAASETRGKTTIADGMVEKAAGPPHGRSPGSVH